MIYFTSFDTIYYGDSAKEVLNIDSIYIKPIEGTEWDSFLKKNTDWIEEILIYGQYISHLVDNTNKVKDASENGDYFHAPIQLLLKECLQSLDGIHSLFKGQSIDISMMLLRNLIELSVYIAYILEKQDLIEKKAVAYELNSIKTRISSYDKIISVSNSDDKIKFSKAKGNLQRVLSKYKIFKEVNSDWSKKVSQSRKEGKGKYINWYSLYDGGNTFKELCVKLNFREIYGVYSLFSVKLHGLDAMSSIYVNNKSECFSMNPKIPLHASELISCVYSCMSLNFVLYIKSYLSEEDMINYLEWQSSIEKTQNSLIKSWIDFRNNIVKNGELY